MGVIMQIEIYIWKMNRKTKQFTIETKITKSDEIIERETLRDFKEDWMIDETTYEYSANIERVIT